MKQKAKAYKILWWTIPLVVLILLCGQEAAFEIQLHDTYLVVALWQIALFLAVTLAFIGGVYWLLREYRLVVGLSLLHSIVTAQAFIGISIIVVCQGSYSSESMSILPVLESGFKLLGLSAILAQLVLIVNIVIALVRGKE